MSRKPPHLPQAWHFGPETPQMTRHLQVAGPKRIARTELPGRAASSAFDGVGKLILPIAIIAAAALSLSACATTQSPRPNITVVNAGVRLPAVADADMSCGDQPGVPARDTATGKRADSVVQSFILALRNWGGGCKDKLDSTRTTWRTVEAKQAEADKKINEIQPK